MKRTVKGSTTRRHFQSRKCTLSPSTVVGPLAASTTYLHPSSRATFSSITSGTAAGMKMSQGSRSISSMVMGSPVSSQKCSSQRAWSR